LCFRIESETRQIVVRLLTGFYIPCIWQEPIVVARCVANATATLMWVLAPTDEILFFVRKTTWMWRMRKMQEHFSTKEKYPKEIRPMPLASCTLAFLSGFAKRDFPVPLAKRGFLPHPSGLYPIKPPVLGAA
jgi:hypothetical protein